MYHKQIVCQMKSLLTYVIYRLGNTLGSTNKFEYNTYEICISMELQDSIILHFVWIFGAKVNWNSDESLNWHNFLRNNDIKKLVFRQRLLFKIFEKVL